uniref:Fibronectin type III and SPRY domain containing 1 n=1 Tax=Cynoglossus semilaevis TaxID=244447 RepID=A0A3P8VFT5_CYNSE
MSCEVYFDLYKDIVFAIITSDHLYHQESLLKITHTLTMKNEEISNFVCTLKQSLDNLEANSTRVQEDLQAEFTTLQSVLDEMKDNMLTRIKQERATRTYELQSQVTACSKALESSEELLELANQTLCSSETDGFSQVKENLPLVTMAPAFRLSLKAKASDNMSHLMVDFSQERELLKSLKFLPVPATPEIQVSECQVCDNTVTVVWTLAEPDSKIDHYILEHRRTNHEGPPRIREDYPWMVVEGIREMEHTITGLRFDTRYMTFRVRACNKAVAGDFSEPVTIETHAFTFKLDAASAHQNLKVEDLSVEWDSSGGKVQEIRKEKNRINSPLHSPARSALASPKRGPTARPGRDRFTAESYTVLADTMIDAGQHYWEVRFDKESKAFAVGVALRSLGRFDQLGKSSASWCIHLNNWLQQSLTAKHNNKARTLDCQIPSTIGVYIHYEEGLLSFYNAKTKQLMHTFKSKFPQPVIPAFMVWNGSFSVVTGLQVPSMVQSGQRRNSGTSSSNASVN